MRDLNGKVAAVTGAASGIGRALAVELATLGCELSLSDVDETGLAETAGRIAGKARVSTHVVDVSDRDRVFAWAEASVREHGRVDLIINNAGVALSDSLETVSYEDFAWVMSINFWGVVHGTQAFLPILKQQPEGHIVNVSSINAMVPFPFNGPYNCAKFAVRGLSQTLLQELAGTRVKVTSVYPGGVRTNIVARARFRRTYVEGLTPEEAAKAFEEAARTSPERAARIIVSGIRKDKAMLLVGADAYVMDALSRLFPVGFTRWTATAFRRSSFPRKR